MPVVCGEGRRLTARGSLPLRYPIGRICKIIHENQRVPSVRDRGVGGSNPLAPTTKSQIVRETGPGNRAFSLYVLQRAPPVSAPCEEVLGRVATWGTFRTSYQASCQTVTKKLSSSHAVVTRERRPTGNPCQPREHREGQPPYAIILLTRSACREARSVPRVHVTVGAMSPRAARSSGSVARHRE